MGPVMGNRGCDEHLAELLAVRLRAVDRHGVVHAHGEELVAVGGEAQLTHALQDGQKWSSKVMVKWVGMKCSTV